MLFLQSILNLAKINKINKRRHNPIQIRENVVTERTQNLEPGLMLVEDQIGLDPTSIVNEFMGSQVEFYPLEKMENLEYGPNIKWTTTLLCRYPLDTVVMNLFQDMIESNEFQDKSRTWSTAFREDFLEHAIQKMICNSDTSTYSFTDELFVVWGVFFFVECDAGDFVIEEFVPTPKQRSDHYNSMAELLPVAV